MDRENVAKQPQVSKDFYEIRLCINPKCGLRYPQANTDQFGNRCPACLGETRVAMRRKLPSYPNGGFSNHLDSKEAGEYLIPLLDNIRSAWNVGSIFRTAGGLGISKIHLCGITPTPENKSVRKTALGAEEIINWDYSHNALKTAQKLKREGHILIALEQDQRAIPINQVSIPKSQSNIIILGNEVSGVDSDLLQSCDYIINIPMLGHNRSFNVEVAFAIASYALMNGKTS